MKDFKIRCSAIGQIMTNPQRKTDTISKTTKSYCQDWLKEQIYGRKKEFSSKYTDKGNEVEQESLNYIAQNLGYDELIKNEKSFENEFLTGTPDAILTDHLIDVKNSWDCYSFPLFFDAIPNKAYYYQAQGYMALTGLDNYKLIYTLMDTPEELIEKEYKFSTADNYELFSQHYKYSSFDSNLRIKDFDIKRDDAVIESIYKRVIDCRMYIKFQLNK
jgi:hypothetical protein